MRLCVHVSDESCLSMETGSDFSTMAVETGAGMCRTASASCHPRRSVVSVGSQRACSTQTQFTRLWSIHTECWIEARVRVSVTEHVRLNSACSGLKDASPAHAWVPLSLHPTSILSAFLQRLINTYDHSRPGHGYIASYSPKRDTKALWCSDALHLSLILNPVLKC
jgi:hypothetical protein